MSWPLVELGDVCEVKVGKTPSRHNAEYWGKGEKWLSIRDMSQGTFIERTKETITEKAIKETNIYLVEKGTVLFSFKLSIGKIGIAQTNLYTNEAIAALPIKDESQLCNDYLVYALTRWEQGIKSHRAVMGATLNKEKLLKLKIPLPPLDEQKRIAAILDKADAIRRKRQQAINIADDFLRSVFLDMFGDIPAKKSEYLFVGCRGAVKAASGKSSKNVKSEIETEIPIYGGNGINGYANEFLYNEPVIVVGRVGQQCAITNLTTGPCWVTDNAIVINVTDHEKYIAPYLAHAFIHSPIRNAVTQLDLPFINQQMILDFPIPKPPIEEQRKFAAIREKTINTTSKLKEALRVSNISFNALSQKAFAGEL